MGVIWSGVIKAKSSFCMAACKTFNPSLKFVALLFGMLLVSFPAMAEIDLTQFFKGEAQDDNYLRLDMNVQIAQFMQNDPWGGNSETFLGGGTSSWSEYGAEAGLEGKFRFGESGMSLTARASGIWTKSRGLDAAGSNLSDTSSSDLTLEDAYLKWTSGDLFKSLGKDALEISAGNQDYQVGNGFLFQSGNSNGGERGGYWHGMRTAFQNTGIVKLTTGNWMVEAVYLEPNYRLDKDTSLAGSNVEYTFGKNGTVGGGYWNILDSDDESRDGLSVFDIRANVTPFENKAISLAGEFVKEDNGSKKDAWATYGEVGYDFGMDKTVTWIPAVNYRYATFSGDNPDSGGKDRSYDPLFYGFNDWNEWYIGEITGEYIAGNSNFNAQTVKLKVKPSKDITGYLFYHYFRINEYGDDLISRPPLSPVGSGAIQNKSFGHEVNLIMDWSATDHINVSATANILLPAEGGRDFFGSSDNWTLFMLWAQVKY
jgi:hypothetical protein